MDSFQINSRLVDIQARRIFPARVTVHDGQITDISELSSEEGLQGFVLPGFIDSHVHIESSMLIPSEFARIAVTHGTIGTVSDPHEIANVCGLQGVEFMIENGLTVPFYFNFGAPSCVPATSFETAGAALDSQVVTKLLQRQEIRYLSEMMNFPGVLHQDEEVMAKISAAHSLGKPVDGHAPGLRGKDAADYIMAGISTDHECFTREEAEEKLKYGMKILIREGSAAKNFDALVGLLNRYPEQMMFCSDDKHPDSLVADHINHLCARAVAAGIEVFNVLQAACINPVKHYNIPSGLLRVADSADFIIVKDLVYFDVLETYIKGQLVAENGRTNIASIADTINYPNQFNCSAINNASIELKGNAGIVPVIEALDGQLITNRLNLPLNSVDGIIQPDPSNDVLKIVVVNRYFDAAPAVSFIRNMGLKEGAIGSSVAHDSHNIVATGVDDESIVRAINLIIQTKGGIACVSNTEEMILPLPVAGLMSAGDGYSIAEQYTAIDRKVKELGSRLSAPFMTLSFMALLVIPHLKLSDKGLFDGDAFELM
ncbi:MAG TPA: adenine deaminase [Flavitalea sp.]|nr:adenine deaminase [Flavitalea sp.]